MSDASRPDNDPSMDDILASIRKIISDDEARAQAAGPGVGAAPPRPETVESPASDVARLLRGGMADAREDVLLLTDLIEEPRSDLPTAEEPRSEAPAAARPIPFPRIDPVKASEMPQPTIDPTPAAPSAPEASSSLIGTAVAGATSSAFERLNQAVKQGAPQPAASDPGPLVGSGGKTLEDLVREMLRPILKEWIDKNLPPMVERLVEREIARLTRG